MLIINIYEHETLTRNLADLGRLHATVPGLTATAFDYIERTAVLHAQVLAGEGTPALLVAWKKLVSGAVSAIREGYKGAGDDVNKCRCE